MSDVGIPLATSWRVIDTSSARPSVLVAHGRRGMPPIVDEPGRWERLQQQMTRFRAKETDHG
jgi:hypothetical protein